MHNPFFTPLLQGISFCLLLSGCEPQSPEAPETLRAVRTQQVSQVAPGNTRVFSGISQSEQEAQLSFRVSGTLIELPVKVGDHLPQGALVARLDPATYELQVEQARATLAQARAAARNASSSYQRIKALYENNNAAKTDLDSARANAESAQAQVRAAEKAMELAGLNVRYTRLTAKQDCAIAQVNVEVNENVNSGSPIVNVDCGQALKVAIAVPESLIAAVEKYQTVQVRFDAIADTVFRGHIEEIGVAATGTGTTFPVSVAIDDRDPSLRSGLAAEVSIAFAGAHGSTNIYLPVSAVNKDTQGTFVFIADAIDGHRAIVRRRYVDIGSLTDQGVAILAGVQTGEHVITAGTKVIRPGMRVRLH